MKDNKLCRNCSTTLEDFYAECLVCIELYLCLKCFSTDLTIEDHKSSHSYNIKETSEGKNLNLFTEEDGDIWTIEEELQLLESVEHYGFGSWIDVSEHVTTKSDLECESHYLKYYVEGNIGEGTLSTNEHPPCCDDSHVGDFREEHCRMQILAVEEQKELGYMVFRDDFIKEYDNEAELSVCDICLHYTDSPIDTEYSTFRVSVFEERLRERLERKRVGKRHDLLHDSTSLGFRSWCVQRKKRSREFKRYQARYIPFAKYMDKQSFVDLYKNISRQERLMKHIKMLRKLHCRGCLKLHGNFKKINGSLNGVGKRKRKSQKSYK